METTVHRAKVHPYGEHWRVVERKHRVLLGRITRAQNGAWQASATMTNGKGSSLGNFATRGDAERAIVLYHEERT